MKGNNIGELEELILITILILKEEAHLLRIQEELKNEAGRSLVMGALHNTLSRLEKKEYLNSFLGEPTKQRGGRRKRLYELTAQGKNKVVELHQIRMNMWNKVSYPGFNINNV
ncbi:MAG: helix-turn-helix transcriptional regulator [Bacteroidota bacterium]